MWAQLTKACLRLEEIETQLSQPETYDDPDLAASLNKEQKDLLPLVEAYRQHQKAQTDLDGLANLLDDPECRQLAKAEETALRAELDRLEEELRLLLQPKDPMDGKDVFLEIRAGVGGEEAALFAADLFRMYSMYGEKQGWRLELTNVNQTELGGVKELSCLVKGADGLRQTQARERGTPRPAGPGDRVRRAHPHLHLHGGRAAPGGRGGLYPGPQ